MSNIEYSSRSRRDFDKQYQEILNKINNEPELRNNNELQQFVLSMFKIRTVTNEALDQLRHDLADISCKAKYVQFDCEARLREIAKE